MGVYNKHMDLASKSGNINLLNELLQNNDIEYTENAMDLASQAGFINVLEWWKNAGLKLKYTSKAFCACDMETREWWINSGLTTNHLFSDSIQVPIKDYLDMLHDILYNN
jgi:hypothetical protein